MKVLFLNPPYFEMFSRESRSPCVTKSSTLYWPMFLSYAAGCIEQDNNEILLLDSPAMGLDLNETLERAEQFNPDLAVVNCSTPSINNDMKVAGQLKLVIGCQLAMMGTHAAAEPQEIIKKEPSIDYVIAGEAEYTVRELVRRLRGEGPPGIHGVQGLVWQEKGVIHVNTERPKIKDLDSLPWVSKVYKKHLYQCHRRYFYGANLNPLIVILTGRGCPFRCTYCVWPQTITGHTYRKRSVIDVVDEMEWIYNNFEEVGEIFFEDDTFTADQDRALELSREIIKRGRKMTWSCNARADVRLDVLIAMKQSGCRELCVGFESASKDVLQNVCKGAANQDRGQFMNNARQAGIIVHGCFMVGNSGDTPETLRATLEMAKELNPNTAQFYPIMVYPGTKAFEEARQKGELVSEDYNHWLDKDGQHNTTVVPKGFTSQELLDFCDQARREFYLRPRYIFNSLIMALTNSRERYRILRGARTLVKHLFRSHGSKAA